MLSLSNQKQIDEVCKALPIGINHFVMYAYFNDGNTFVLSNVHAILKPEYPETILQANEGYYLCNENESFKTESEQFKKLNLYPIYNLVRKSTECTFVFIAIKESHVEDGELFYKKTEKKFENFCVSFVNQFIELIVHCNPNYRHAFIFNNRSFRDAVIRQGYSRQPAISLREQECLWLASQGKSVKQIAQILKISPFTVEKYLKQIREELQCSTLIEAIIEGIHRGLIGKLSPFEFVGSQRKSKGINDDFSKHAVTMTAA